MSIRFLPIILILFFTNQAFADEVCQSTGQTCVEGAATRNIGGQPVYKPCWKYQTNYRCFQPEVDYCDPLKTLGCEQLNSTCTATDAIDGNCNNYQNSYRCHSLLTPADPNITLINSSYKITKDYLDYSKCEGRDVLPNCGVVDSVCKQSEATRNINGLDVHKSCWQFENIYSCKIGGTVNSCTNIPSYCQFSSSQCLSQTGSMCVHTQNTYLCSQTQQLTPTEMQCGSNVYCLNGQCQQIEDNSPNEFAKAVAYLQAINQSKDNSQDPNNLKIFSGNSKGCSIKAGGYNNCCKDQGWGQDINASCNAEEVALAQLQSKKQCHYVGSYCSDKKPFGICLETTKTSCCFNSKISRVLVEQGRAQLGIGWGSPEAPNCAGFTTEQLQSLRFDKMDLSEISADIASSVVVPDTKYLQDKASEAINRLSTTSTNH